MAMIPEIWEWRQEVPKFMVILGFIVGERLERDIQYCILRKEKG